MDFHGRGRGSQSKSKRRTPQRHHGKNKIKYLGARVLEGGGVESVKTDYKLELLCVNLRLLDFSFLILNIFIWVFSSILSIAIIPCVFLKIVKKLSPYFLFLFAFKRKLVIKSMKMHKGKNKTQHIIKTPRIHFFLGLKMNIYHKGCFFIIFMSKWHFLIFSGGSTCKRNIIVG